MSAAVERAAAMAVDRALDRMERLAADDLPADIAAERVDAGLRLTGPAILARRVTDARLRGLALAAMRRGA